MEKQLRFVLLLPLEQIALRKVAVGLWAEPDVLASIANFRGLIGIGDWKKKWRETVESKVFDKISKLPLPESLKEQIIQILNPIGLQILRWKAFHEFSLNQSKHFFPSDHFDVPILEKLHWTAAATVDYRKTAEELVRSGVLDVLNGYKLACVYCLDRYLPELWKELPHENKMYFYDEEDLSNIGQIVLQFCWPYILKGEEYKLDDRIHRLDEDLTTFRQYMFTRLSIDGNKSAAEYFLQMLTPEERETSLNKIAHNALIDDFDTFPLSFPKENAAEVLIFLLSQMNPEQQNQIFRKGPASVLGCFLCWPWQEVFLDIADSMWPWMRCERLECRAGNYDTLLDKLQDSVQDSNYCSPNLYQNFFLRSPSDFKKHLVDRECERRHDSTFLTELFYVQDTETINVILSNVDAGDRLRLVSSKRILKSFYNSISRDRGHVVEMCLRDTGLSKEDKASLKKAFKAILERRARGAIESPKWTRFFKFLDEIESRDQIKRMTDDKTLSEAKKLCSVVEENISTK